MIGFSNVNKCTFVGRVGKAPTVTEKGNGEEAYKMTKFSVAVSKKRGQKETTLWINCISFTEGHAKWVSNWVHAGDLVYVSGELSAQAYVSEKTSKPVADVSLHLEDVFVLQSKKDGNGQAAAASSDAPAAEPAGEQVPWEDPAVMNGTEAAPPANSTEGILF